MDTDEIIDDIILQVENSLFDDPPALYYGDDSIGAYEYWGAKMVDPPKPYVEIDEFGRDIVIKNSYSDQKSVLEALSFFYIPDSKECTWHSYILYDNNHYNYHITKAIINQDNIEISIEWDDFEEYV